MLLCVERFLSYSDCCQKAFGKSDCWLASFAFRFTFLLSQSHSHSFDSPSFRALIVLFAFAYSHSREASHRGIPHYLNSLQHQPSILPTTSSYTNISHLLLSYFLHISKRYSTTHLHLACLLASSVCFKLQSFQNHPLPSLNPLVTQHHVFFKFPRQV